MRTLTALTLALFAGPALAADDNVLAIEPVAIAVPERVKAEPEKKICKVVDIESGTRMRKKTCKTAAEWKTTRSGNSGGPIKSISAE